jgi:hypothetical protein
MQKGGRKLRRGPIKASYYKAQFLRTARNKAAARERIARRKRDNPNLKRARVITE